MGDAGNSSSTSDCGSPQPKGKSTNKVFVFEKGKAYTMWKSVGTSELLGQS